MPRPRGSSREGATFGAGLARALSKLGICSRKEAENWIAAGRVRVNGRTVASPAFPVDLNRDRIEVDQRPVRAREKVYLMLNKPRGLVTSTSDEQGRETVYHCFAGQSLPPLSPVGRLDKASEGLLLFTNDTHWAAQITAPESHLKKAYHVQVDCLADDVLARQLTEGVPVGGEVWRVKSARLLRTGTRNSWLEIILDEGKNRQIRRLLDALEIGVLRLVRVAIGPLELGPLAKGEFRRLDPSEVAALGKSK